MRARALLSPLAVLLTLLCYGCATTLPPAAVAMDDQFAAGQVHATQLLLLPTEVQIALFNEAGPAPQSLELEVSRAASAILENATRRALEGQGYPVAGVLTWDGAAQLRDGRRVQALDAEGMALLYGAVAQGQAPPPEVLAAAQSATGADAVLFLAASGQDIPGESTGEKVAKGIFIGLFIAVIAIALIASHHSGGSRAAGIGRGAGSAVAGAARVGASVHVAMPSGVVAGALRPVIVPLPVGHVHTAACNIFLGIHDGLLYAPAPAPAPELAGKSGLGVSMRLVSLHDARMLWSADQFAEGSPREADFVRALGVHLARALPAAR